MDELKLILDTIASLGIEAKWAFYVWLAYKLLNTVLYIGGTCFALWMVVNRIMGDVDTQQIRDAMRVGSPGAVTRGEYREMLAWVQNHSERTTR